MPSKKGLLDYETEVGKIKHYYGFEYALGGIISIKGGDFELLNGYPNYWSWSLEDNCLQKRAQRNRITIDRSNFYKVQTPQCFLSADIQKAYSQDFSEIFTDDASVFEANGGKINTLLGEEKNLKITTEKDLKIASILI